MKVNSCGVDVSGTKCVGDHSRLLHASGNVYCGAAKSRVVPFKKSSSPSTSPSASVTSCSDPFSMVDESEDAIYFVQDIPFKSLSTSFKYSSPTCRILWDKGSNRVLIREDFAFSNRLPFRGDHQDGSGGQ